MLPPCVTLIPHNGSRSDEADGTCRSLAARHALAATSRAYVPTDRSGAAAWLVDDVAGE